MSNQVFIYFGLTAETAETEAKALAEVWEILKPYAVGTKLHNEGHDGNEWLVCYFTVYEDRLGELAECIRRVKGGGDDIVYLNDGSTACGFGVVRRPGLDRGVPLVDFDE